MMISRRLKILCGAVVYSGMAIETLNPKPKILAARDALLPEDSFYLALEAAAQGRFGDDPGRYFKGWGSKNSFAGGGRGTAPCSPDEPRWMVPGSGEEWWPEC